MDLVRRYFFPFCKLPFVQKSFEFLNLDQTIICNTTLQQFCVLLNRVLMWAVIVKKKLVALSFMVIENFCRNSLRFNTRIFVYFVHSRFIRINYLTSQRALLYYFKDFFLIWWGAAPSYCMCFDDKIMLFRCNETSEFCNKKLLDNRIKFN